MKSKSIRVFLIEDNPGDARLIREMLTEVSRAQFHLNWADSLSTGLERLAEGEVDAVLLDLSLPDSQGIDTFRKLHTQAPQIPTILMTGLNDESLAVAAVREGAQDYLVKGQVDSNLLTRTILYAIERKHAEEALRESEKRYRELTDLLPQSVFEVDRKGNFMFINRYGLESSGYTRQDFSKGLNALQMFAPQERNRVLRNMRIILGGEQLDGVEYMALRRDGSTYPVILYATTVVNDGETVGLRGIVIDITERKRMEEEILRAQKIESIGLFAGGLAHDFNNLLTAILGNISFAGTYTDPDKISERLREATKASLRAKDLTQQLLTFSKGGMPIIRTTCIADLVRGSASFVLRGSNVRCEFCIPNDLWPVEVDEGQVNQVINNLVINADQAMPEGGIIRIRCENVNIETSHGLPLPPGDFVCISIQDQGIGIPVENINRIFDPYFTTKEKGNGLGLATTYSVIKKHNGNITVESLLGKGTTFRIYLPASPQKILKDKGEEGSMPDKLQGKILVMDDEEPIRELVSNVLGVIGCETIMAGDGADAIDLYREARESRHPFDLVIMDLTIPGGLGGKETIQKLMEIDPEVNAIASSGYSNDPIMANFKEYGFRDAISKPYTVEELVKKVHKAISNYQMPLNQSFLGSPSTRKKKKNTIPINPPDHRIV